LRSLFLRIFLWVWVAMLALVVALVLTSPLWTRSRPGVERWQRGAARMLEERVQEAAAAVERGQDPVGASGRRHPGPPGPPMRVLVLDDSGAEVAGRPVDRAVREIARRALATGEEALERSGTEHLMARPAVGADGRTRVVVVAMRHPPAAIDLLDPRVVLPRLAMLTMVVGLFCFVLARHLSAPFGTLRTATQRLAAGDLSARVGEEVARRRDEIGDLARDFDAMAERLEQLVSAQRGLLRDVSHELRSPLARLEVALELARRRSGDAAAEALDRIGRESGRLDELIGQLLSLARLDSGAVEPKRDGVDLGRLLGEVVADARFEAESTGRAVALFVERPATVRGAAELLRSALENVVRNAIVHAPAATEIDVSLTVTPAADGGETAAIIVRDRGPGVPEPELERLFEPFHRVSDARERQSGGVGLGLAITRRAVEWHGGRVTASNHPDGGLEVTIRLPLF
jgi:two-component system sensor histidine kinase CpxA